MEMGFNMCHLKSQGKKSHEQNLKRVIYVGIKKVPKN